MKPIHFVTLVFVAALGGIGGWFAARHWPVKSASSGATLGTTRKVLYYQSSMHPCIKSDKPGRCTICGMELAPVFEGEKGFDAAEGIVTLGSNSIQVINVESEEIKRRPLRRTLRVAGTIDDNDAKHRFVSAYVDGRIDKLDVNFVGAEVVAGQPLATFYSPTLLATEREYVALRQQQASTGTAALKADHTRLLDAAAQRLKRLGLTDTQIGALPHKDVNAIHSEILAPVSGTVVARSAYAGQYVKEGEKLFEIADFATMWFQFDAYERDLAWLKIGQKVAVTTPSVPGRSFAGVVTFIDPNLREMTRSAKVRVELSNPIVEDNGRKRRELFHRLYADAEVELELPEVLTVVRSAVLSPGSQPMVYVDRGSGAYEQRRIKLGRAGDELWEVLEGVREGERIVTSGNMLIDAQAQLNQSAKETAPPKEVAPGAAPASVEPQKFTEAEQKAINAFLTTAGAISEALAADNLADFNREGPKLHATMPALLDAFDKAPTWQPLAAKIEANSHFEQAVDLAAARKAFLPFSSAATEFVARLRRQPEFGAVKIYRCPMVNRAIPGAPKIGQWIQVQGPLRNPYFGADMLDCGEEVKP